MSSTPSVAVIIPTFNRTAFLGQSLRSALDQTCPPAEILVVDDGSTEDAAGVAAGFGGAVRFIRQENTGKSAAINNGIENSRSDAILVLDDDDLLPPTALADHVQALRRQPAAGFSFGRYARFMSGLTLPEASRDIEPVDEEDRRRLFIRLLEHDFLPNPSWMVRRGLMRKVGPYSTALRRSQDFEMILRLCRVASGAFTDSVVLWQREHEALRGQGSERRKETHTIDLWIKYDALMMASLDLACADEDFRPFDGAVPSRTLVLQRAVSNFGRNNFEAALKHLERFARVQAGSELTALEGAIATRLLSASHGLEAAIAEGPGLGARIRALRFPVGLRRRLAAQSAWRFKAAVKQCDFGLARRLWRFTTRTFGITPIEAAMIRVRPYPMSSDPERSGEGPGS